MQATFGMKGDDTRHNPKEFHIARVGMELFEVDMVVGGDMRTRWGDLVSMVAPGLLKRGFSETI